MNIAQLIQKAKEIAAARGISKEVAFRELMLVHGKAAYAEYRERHIAIDPARWRSAVDETVALTEQMR